MRLRGFILFVFAAAIGLASCKNNDSLYQPITYTGINVINASADTVNFYVNGTRLNGLSSLYPVGALGLYAVPSGAQNYQFKKNGKPDVIYSLPLTLAVQTFNSIYYTGLSTERAFKTTDTILAISSKIDTIAVRFVNASPDAGNLRFFVGDTVNFKTRPYKSSSIFLISGSGIKRVRVYLEGASTPRLDTVMTFQQETNYTLFTKGSLTGKGNATFNVGRIINPFNYQN